MCERKREREESKEEDKENLKLQASVRQKKCVCQKERASETETG